MISNECLAGLLSFENVVSILGGYETPFLVSAEKVFVFRAKAEDGQYDYEHFHRKFIGVKWARVADGPLPVAVQNWFRVAQRVMVWS